MIQLPDRKLYSSPDDDTTTVFLDYIQTAKSRLLIVDYSFNIVQFETILPELKSKGIEVSLVLDRSQSKGSTEKPVIAALKSAEIPMVIGTSDKRKIIHDKFAIVDDSVLYGSWNFTNAASDEDNFFIIDSNPDVTDWFVSIYSGILNWILLNEPQK